MAVPDSLDVSSQHMDNDCVNCASDHLCSTWIKWCTMYVMQYIQIIYIYIYTDSIYIYLYLIYTPNIPWHHSVAQVNHGKYIGTTVHILWLLWWTRTVLTAIHHFQNGFRRFVAHYPGLSTQHWYRFVLNGTTINYFAKQMQSKIIWVLPEPSGMHFGTNFSRLASKQYF